MAGYATSSYMPSPGEFKARDAEPEVTLENFNKYIKKMDKVFKLTRRRHPTTGAKQDYDDEEKKDMLQVEGGDDMVDLFEHVGKVDDADSYAAAVEKIRTALRKQGSRTAAVFRLFNGHTQGLNTFESWHREIYQQAKLIDWTDYNAEKAAVDAIIMQTSSHKLQQRALQENPTYPEMARLGTTQEQARKKADGMPNGKDDEKAAVDAIIMQTSMTNIPRQTILPVPETDDQLL
jgi:hypothetical protein